MPQTKERADVCDVSAVPEDVPSYAGAGGRASALRRPESRSRRGELTELRKRISPPERSPLGRAYQIGR